MARPFQISEEAEQDLYDAAHYIAKNNIEAAKRFLESLNETCMLLVDLPETGTVVQTSFDELRDTRMFRVENFAKYLIFYRLAGRKRMKVIRVIHAARDYTFFFERE